jgi:hypothetical protein
LILFFDENVDYNWGSYLEQQFCYISPRLRKEQIIRRLKNMVQFINRYVLPEAQQVMKIGSMSEFGAGNRLDIL